VIDQFRKSPKIIFTLAANSVDGFSSGITVVRTTVHIIILTCTVQVPRKLKTLHLKTCSTIILVELQLIFCLALRTDNTDIRTVSRRPSVRSVAVITFHILSVGIAIPSPLFFNYIQVSNCT
jgi:hypothetical protein